MEKKVEMAEFLGIIDSKEYTEFEKNISNNIEYLIIYRIRKFYGLYDNIMVRGSFESIYECDLLSMFDTIDYRLKQTLWQYGIIFSNETYSNLTYTDESDRRCLLIAPVWEGVDKLTEQMDSEEFNIRPTDLYIENLKDNNEYDEVLQVLTKSKIETISVWFVRSNYDYYASYTEKSKVFNNLFSEHERYDITQDMHEMFDVLNFPCDIVDKLINFGRELYNAGVKCIEFNDIIPELNNIQENKYQYLCAVYLVYLSETYNMKINTTSDGMFCSAFNSYRSGNYLMAEDLLSLEYKLFPVMFYTTTNNSRFIYVRDVVSSYDYVYVTERELEKMIIGDEQVKMKLWKPEEKSLFINNRNSSGTGYLSNKVDASKSSFAEKITSDEDDAYNPEVVKLFDRYDEAKIANIVKVFNSYNIRENNIYSQKYVTVRDLLCRRVKDGDEDVYQIGFIFSGSDAQYGKRLTQKIVVSGIEPTHEGNMINRSYFTMPQEKIGSLYSLNYIYDLSSEAPQALVKLIGDTESLIEDVSDPMLFEDEDGNETYEVGSMEEKFLYYVFSRHIGSTEFHKLEESLVGDKAVFKTALFKYVFIASEIMPELAIKLKMYDLIKAEFLTAYGDINPEYIRSGRAGSYLNLDSRLFGIMSSD